MRKMSLNRKTSRWINKRREIYWAININKVSFMLFLSFKAFWFDASVVRAAFPFFYSNIQTKRSSCFNLLRFLLLLVHHRFGLAHLVCETKIEKDGLIFHQAISNWKVLPSRGEIMVCFQSSLWVSKFQIIYFLVR